ncbi:MAG: hypothetical protein KKI08_13820 [Armatimonadetes bacterium]|nr:hypothetical protein [Armatimonadota bacterium]
MRHGGHMHGGHLAIGGLESIIPLLVILIALAGVAVLVWWLSSRRRPEPSSEEAAQEETRQNLDGQIMAMLHQAGRAMPQSHMRVALSIPIDELAVALRRLEEQGRVLRTWQAEEYTFTVRTA